MDGLRNLPFEMACEVAQYLALPDLQSLSLVNSACDSVASTQLFRKIRLILMPVHTLSEQLQTWEHLLARRQALSYVKILEIVDHPPGVSNVQGPQLKSVGPYRIDCQHYQKSGPPEQNSALCTLSTALASFRALTDLVWASCYQFPAVLLHTLQENHRNCRLHIEGFRVYGMPNEPNQPGQSTRLTAHEISIITSPSLHKVSMRCCIDKFMDFTCHQDLLLSMVQGLSPALEIVHLLPPCLTRVSMRRTLIAAPPLLDFTDLIDTKPMAKGALHTLDIQDYSQILYRDMQAWFEATKSSQLRSLRLQRWLEKPALCYLASLQWPSLWQARLCLPPLRHSELLEQLLPHYVELLQQFCSLQDLEMGGGMNSSTMRAITELCGRNLSRLSLPTLLVQESKELRCINLHCPRLVELKIATQRLEGDGKEAELYQTLGQFRNLQHLILLLDCSISVEALQVPPGVRSQPKTRDHSHLLSMLRGVPALNTLGDQILVALCRAASNAHMNPNVASSIFYEVSCAKPACAAPLRTLDVLLRRVGEVRDLCLDDAQALLRLLPTSFGLRDDDEAGISCRCVGQESQNSMDGCIVKPIRESSEVRDANIEDSSIRGINVRPVVRRLITAARL